MNSFNDYLENVFHLDVKKMEIIFKDLNDLKLNLDAFSFVVAKIKKQFSIYINKKEVIFQEGKKYIIPIYILYDLFNIKNEYLGYLDKTDVKFSDILKLYNDENLNNKTILLFRTGGIGDLIFIQPSLFEIKRRFPSCKIWFATIPSNFDLIKNWSCIDQILTIPIEYDIFMEADFRVSFHGVIEKTKQAEKENAYILFNKWLNLNSDVKKLYPKLETEKNNDKYIQKILKKFQIKDYIYIQPNASVVLRTPGLTTWLYIISYFVDQKKQIIINTKPEHKKMVDYIISFVKPQYRQYIFNLSEYSTSLGKMMSFIKFSNLVIAPDSSSIHLAAGLNKYVYGIYGPFPGEIRMSTYKKAKWIEPDSPKEKIIQCKYGGKHCCLHTSSPCPYNIKNISACFYNLNYEKMYKDLDHFYNRIFK